MDTGELLIAVADGGDTATVVPVTSLEAAGLLERQHLQEWIVAHPEILGPGVMVVAVEYDAWIVDGGASRDRLDVLGLDLDGRLVVAELKRGVAPDMVEMQAVKYAAMASRFRLDTLAAALVAFRKRRGETMTADEALEALQSHASTVADDTLADPRLVIVAQGFSPVVISSVVWLADRGVDISLVRFQPYQQPDGHVFVTFSRLYPLPDLEKSIVGPGQAAAEIATDRLPVVPWTVADLVTLGRIANLTTRVALDVLSDRPEESVSLTEIVDAAGVTRPEARGQLAGLTMAVKRRLQRRNWPFQLRWAADGSSQAFYMIDPETALRWKDAVVQLDAEQSDVGAGPLLDPKSEDREQS